MSAQYNWQTDPGYIQLKAFIIERTGLIYFNDKDADLYQRLSRRFEALALTNCQIYFDILRNGPDASGEFDRMVVELTIGETYFFRHQEQFDALKSKVIPDILARNEAPRRLRIWCAGCSIGAEPYSLAIMLAEDFGSALIGWDAKIIATDINRAFLAKAEAGVFDDWAFRTTSKELRERHFVPVQKSWMIKPDHKKLVEFHYHNLLNSPMPVLKDSWASIDLIICRNVMIYFDWSTVANSIMPHFESSLGNDGWLVIGHAEQAHGAKSLTLTQLPGVSLYQKTSQPQDPPSIFARPATPVLSTMAGFVPPVFVAPILPPVPAISTAASMGSSLAADIGKLRRLADEGKFEKALTFSDELLFKHKLDARPYYYRALILEHLGRRRDVETNLLQAIQLDHRFVMAHYYLALFYRQNKDLKKAKGSFQSVRTLIENLDDAVPIAEADDLNVGDLKMMVASKLEAA